MKQQEKFDKLIFESIDNYNQQYYIQFDLLVTTLCTVGYGDNIPNYN